MKNLENYTKPIDIKRFFGANAEKFEGFYLKIWLLPQNAVGF